MQRVVVVQLKRGHKRRAIHMGNIHLKRRSRGLRRSFKFFAVISNVSPAKSIQQQRRQSTEEELFLICTVPAAEERNRCNSSWHRAEKQPLRLAVADRRGRRASTCPLTFLSIALLFPSDALTARVAPPSFLLIRFLIRRPRTPFPLQPVWERGDEPPETCWLSVETRADV